MLSFFAWMVYGKGAVIKKEQRYTNIQVKPITHGQGLSNPILKVLFLSFINVGLQLHFINAIITLRWSQLQCPQILLSIGIMIRLSPNVCVGFFIRNKNTKTCCRVMFPLGIHYQQMSCYSNDCSLGENFNVLSCFPS